MWSVSRFPLRETAPRADASFAHPPCQAAGGIMLQFRIRPFTPCHHRHPACRQQHLTVLQAGGHEGPEIRFGKRSDQSQDRIIPRILRHPGQHPQQRRPGKRIQLCQSEVHGLPVHGDRKNLHDFAHRKHPLRIFIYRLEYDMIISESKLTATIIFRITFQLPTASWQIPYVFPYRELFLPDDERRS